MPQSAALSRTILWMVGALLSFISMAIAGRELAGELSVTQLLVIRSTIGVLIIASLIQRQPQQWQLLKTPTPGLHLIRNTAHFVGQYGWFVAIGSIPLAEVFALEFTTPIWCLLLAPLLVGEKITRVRAAAVLLGFIGILIILRPGIAIIHPAALGVLGAAICFSIAYLMTKKITGQKTAHGSQSPLTLLFYMCLVQMLLSAIPALTDWTPVASQHLPWLLLVSVTALSAHYCITRALKLADASVVVPIDFLRLPLIALLGYLVYDETLDIWVLVGAAVMLGGNYLNLWSEQKRLKRLQQEIEAS